MKCALRKCSFIFSKIPYLSRVVMIDERPTAMKIGDCVEGYFLPEALAERIIAYLSEGIPNKEGREILEELTRER